MIRAGLRRLLVVLVVVLGGTAAISAALGALAGRSVPHAIAVGYYVAAAGSLVISFALGSRGPTRADNAEDEEPPPVAGVFGVPRAGRAGRRARRKVTPEERRETRLASLGLFAFGVLLVLLGGAIDPARRLF